MYCLIHQRLSANCEISLIFTNKRNVMPRIHNGHTHTIQQLLNFGAAGIMFSVSRETGIRVLARIEKLPVQLHKNDGDYSMNVPRKYPKYSH